MAYLPHGTVAYKNKIKDIELTYQSTSLMIDNLNLLPGNKYEFILTGRFTSGSSSYHDVMMYINGDRELTNYWSVLLRYATDQYSNILNMPLCGELNSSNTDTDGVIKGEIILTGNNVAIFTNSTFWLNSGQLQYQFTLGNVNPISSISSIEFAPYDESQYQFEIGTRFILYQI